MTNGWVDIKNTDMMLIMGGNPAENHPCGFKWVVEAKRNRNAKVIVVDPIRTPTAAARASLSGSSPPAPTSLHMFGACRASPSAPAVESAENAMVAKQTVELESAKARQALRLVELLEDLEDVQRVTANFDIPEDVFAEVAG